MTQRKPVLWTALAVLVVLAFVAFIVVNARNGNISSSDEAVDFELITPTGS